MSARIKVTEEVVGAALQSVTRSRAAFERAGAVSDAASGAVGHRPLADALDDFADNWRITRNKLTSSMRALEMNLGKAREELERWDQGSVPSPSQTPPSPSQGTTPPSQGPSGGAGGGGLPGNGGTGDSLQQSPAQQSPVQQSPVPDPLPPQKGGVEDPGFDRVAPDPTVGQDPELVQPVPPEPGTGSTDPDDLPPTPLTPTQPPVTDDTGSSGEPLDSSESAEEGSGVGDAALLGGAGLAGALAGTAGAAMRGAAAGASGGSSGGSGGSLPTGGGAGLPTDALGKLDPLTGDDKTDAGSFSRDLPDLAPTVTEDQLPGVGSPVDADKASTDSSVGGVKAAAPLLGGAAVAGGGAGGVALHNKFGAGAVEPPEPPRADTDRVKRARESLEELRRKRSEQYHTQDDETEEI